jgi:hypothetical protein
MLTTITILILKSSSGQISTLVASRSEALLPVGSKIGSLTVIEVLDHTIFNH